MALNPNVVVVAPDELITAAHINNIRSNLDRLDTSKVLDTGDTMSGTLIVGGNPLTAGAPSPGVLISETGLIASARNVANSPNVTLNRHGSANAVGQVLEAFTINLAMSSLGTITIASGTSVAYNTTSDPRTKTPPGATRGISDAAARAQALGRLAWQGVHVDPETGEPETGPQWDFLSSHDIEDVAPYAVHGERDAVDADTGAAIWQQVSFPDLVPLLFAALADALDRIEVLEGGAP
jgi:hypothetical protein